MHRVSGWWIGASVVPTRTELWSLAQAAGGWAALSGAGVNELIELGVEPQAARVWVGHADGTSRGVPVDRADARYPRALLEDERAPPVLYLEGDLGLLDRPAVAVVGTRRCSDRGSAIARALARDLAQRGIAVVSGLALGIDTAAHQGALAARDGRTIAVLGHGLRHQAPSSNRRLRDQIAERGGLSVAGWPDDTPPERWTFPARNRWIAGLSSAVVMVEGPVRSGAGITAKDALELGIDVWVVPGPPDQPVAAGPLDLLRRQMDEDAEQTDLLRLRLREALELIECPESATPLRRSALVAATRERTRGRVRLLESVQAFVEGIAGPGEPQQVAWLSHLLSGATVDEVAQTWKRPVIELQAELTRRELRGELVRLSGGRYARGT